jgi:pimeloyl-ACP methyl ester carboxylesterase
MTEPVPHPTSRERSVATNGIELHVVEAGPEDGYPVVLAHGFPDLAYSWRHQLPVLADAGYHVLAPDQRGYGLSDKPEAIEDYDIHHLTDDLLGLLDDIGADEALFVGHDWGSMLVGQMALLHPERMAGVVAMSVPLLPRGAMPPVQMMRQLFGDSFFYILYFQEPGVADADLAADPAESMTRMLAGLTLSAEDDPDAAGLANADGLGFVDRLPEAQGLPPWLSRAELDHYIAEFRRTGFTGGLNWYRNLDRNWETTPDLDGVHVTIPSTFITGTADPVNLMTPAGVMEGHVLDHRGNTFVEGAGHWVQQQAPDEVNAALLAFFSSLDLGGS